MLCLLVHARRAGTIACFTRSVASQARHRVECPPIDDDSYTTSLKRAHSHTRHMTHGQFTRFAVVRRSAEVPTAAAGGAGLHKCGICIFIGSSGCQRANSALPPPSAMQTRQREADDAAAKTAAQLRRNAGGRLAAGWFDVNTLPLYTGLRVERLTANTFAACACGRVSRAACRVRVGAHIKPRARW